jgi:hypothetical protein
VSADEHAGNTNDQRAYVEKYTPAYDRLTIIRVD